MGNHYEKVPIRSISDHFFRAIFTFTIGVGWFVLLWGVRLSALTAGLSLGGLLWLCTRQFSKRSSLKRESKLRQSIGGSLAINRLLWAKPHEATHQCALWLGIKYPLLIQKEVNWNILCLWEGQEACIRVLIRHPSHTVTVQETLECIRKASAFKKERTILCTTAALDHIALSYAASFTPPVHVIEGKELIDLAGQLSPATDEDLDRRTRNKKPRRSAHEWLAVVLDESRTRKYFWYGIGLSALSLTTGNTKYPFPAIICMMLYTACKIRQTYIIRNRRWKG